MIFVDTSAWYAAWVASDPYHQSAAEFAAAASQRFVTTDYVVDEFLTLLRMRGQHQRAQLAAERVAQGRLSRIEWVRPADVLSAIEVFRTYQDKRWSFTDCVSLVAMRRLGVTQAFAFDDHFRQFGGIVVLPTH